MMRYFIYSLLVFNLGCKEVPGFKKTHKDAVVARVEDKTLMLSQIKEMVHEGISKTDSAAVVDGFIQNWVRENLMIKEAEKNIAADININKLVDDYRSSLLVYNYEKFLVETKLDTIVTKEDKMRYYEKNKGQYLLSHPIFTGVIVKISSKSSSLQTIKTKLEKNDWHDLEALLQAKANMYRLDTTMYWTLDDVYPLVPEGMIASSNIVDNKVLSKREKDFDYFIKIIRGYREHEVPPYDFIESKITKSILSERKIQLLNQFRQDLFDKGLKENKFEIYKNS